MKLSGFSNLRRMIENSLRHLKDGLSFLSGRNKPLLAKDSTAVKRHQPLGELTEADVDEITRENKGLLRRLAKRDVGGSTEL